MGKSQYYPPSAPELSENRLFGMFHASTPQHSKDVIMGSLQDCHGTVSLVLASVAMGMIVSTPCKFIPIHYGAPSSIEDYFQASGRRGQSGDSGIIREHRTGEVTVSAGTRSSSPTASTTLSSPLKEAELICCCFL